MTGICPDSTSCLKEDRTAQDSDRATSWSHSPYTFRDVPSKFLTHGMVSAHDPPRGGNPDPTTPAPHPDPGASQLPEAPHDPGLQAWAEPRSEDSAPQGTWGSAVSTAAAPINIFRVSVTNSTESFVVRFVVPGVVVNYSKPFGKKEKQRSSFF